MTFSASRLGFASENGLQAPADLNIICLVEVAGLELAFYHEFAKQRSVSENGLQAPADLNIICLVEVAGLELAFYHEFAKQRSVMQTWFFSYFKSHV